MLIFALVNKLLSKVVNPFHESMFLKRKIKFLRRQKLFWMRDFFAHPDIYTKDEKKKPNSEFRSTEIIQYPGLFGSISTLEGYMRTKVVNLKKKKSKYRNEKDINAGEKERTE